MPFWGNVTGYLVGKFRGGNKSIAIHEFTAGAKAETSMSGFAPGIEINPADGENLIITKIKNSTSFVVSIGGVNQSIAPDTDRGERRIYSVSSGGGEIKAVAKFKNDGVLELNGGTSSAVKFEELESGLNAAISTINANLAVKLDGGGTAGTTVLNIAPAKSADVKLS